MPRLSPHPLRTLLPLRRPFSTTSTAHSVLTTPTLASIETRLTPSPTAASYHKPVLVDFFATWCQPCKLLAPTLHRIAQTDQVDLVTVDVDTYQELAQRFQVRAMPTVLLMKRGQVVDGFVGMLPEKKVVEFVEKHTREKADP